MKKCYRLERAGETRFRVTGDVHCGPTAEIESDGRINMRWQIRLECAPGSLDHKGFLVDQTELARFMDAFGDRLHAGSCEVLAAQLCDEIRHWAREQNPDIDVTGIAVELRSAPYRGAIAAEWAA